MEFPEFSADCYCLVVLQVAEVGGDDRLYDCKRGSSVESLDFPADGHCLVASAIC